MGDEFAAGGDGDRAGRERTGVDGARQDVEGAAQTIVLRPIIAGKEREAGGGVWLC